MDLTTLLAINLIVPTLGAAVLQKKEAKVDKHAPSYSNKIRHLNYHLSLASLKAWLQACFPLFLQLSILIIHCIFFYNYLSHCTLIYTGTSYCSLFTKPSFIILKLPRFPHPSRLLQSVTQLNQIHLTTVQPPFFLWALISSFIASLQQE